MLKFIILLSSRKLRVPALVLPEVIHGHLVDQIVCDTLKLSGDFLLQLWLHGLDDLVAILLQEQVGRIRWK